MNKTRVLALSIALLCVGGSLQAAAPLQAFITNDERSTSGQETRVRVVDLSPGAGPVDVWINDALVFPNVVFGGITRFAAAGPAQGYGDHHIALLPAGAGRGSTAPLWESDEVFSIRKDNTIVVVGPGSPGWVGAQVVAKTPPSPSAGHAMVRVLHGALDAAAMSVSLVGGPSLSSWQEQWEWTEYQEVPAGTYEVEADWTGGTRAVIVAHGVTFAAGGAYTVYLAGSTADTATHLYYVPGIAHARGMNDAFWVSDLTVFNPSSDAAQVELSFRGNGEAAAIQRTIASRQQLTLADVLSSGFGIAGDDVGVITVNSTAPVEAHARTYSQGVDPQSGAVTTYGESYPGMEPSEALPGTHVGYLTGLRSDGAYRSNLELVNAGDEDATVEVRFFDADGTPIGGDLSREVAPGRRVGITAALPAGHPSAYAEIRLTPPEAKVIAFGSVIDGTSNDPTRIPATRGPLAPTTALDGTWVGQVELWSVNSGNKPAKGCIAEHLSGVFAADSETRVTIQDGFLTVNAIGPEFGACAPAELEDSYGDTVVDLTCDLGLPRDVTCDGATWRLSLGSPQSYGTLGSGDSMNLAYNPSVLASPAGGGTGTRFDLFFVLALERTP